MDLQIFIKNLYSKLHLGVIFSVGFALLTLLIVSQLPRKHTLNGSFLVMRDTSLNTESGEFQYEGYYARQNAVLFTSTLAGLVENNLVLARVLESQHKPVTAVNLFKLRLNIKVSTSTPQVVDVVYTASSVEDLQSVWETLRLNVLDLASEFGSSDPSIRLSVLAEPVVYTSYPDKRIAFISGFMLGLTVYATYVYLRSNGASVS